MRSFGFSWNCECGAAFKARMIRSPQNPDIRPMLDRLRKEWESVHKGEGHRETDGHAAAWARRKAEEAQKV